MILNPATRVRTPEWGLIYYEASITAQGLPEPSIPYGVIHWVPEQLNIKAVTGACKLIDGCSLALCLATVSVRYQLNICHRNESQFNCMTLS